MKPLHHLSVNNKSNIYYTFSILSISLATSIIIYIVFGTYFEAYEGLLSSFVHGTYTEYALDEYIFDVHFLMLPIYAKINKIIPDYQFYGWYLFTLNILSHSILLYYLADVYSSKKRIDVYTILILIPISFLISIDNIINLSTTRIVFVSSASLFMHIIIKSRAQELNLLGYIKILFLFSFISLLRIDAALLASIFFLGFTLLFIKKFHLLYLIPLFIGILTFTAFNITLKFSENEAKKAFYYQELDLIDRNHIDYDSLSKINLLDVEALTHYCIADKNMFNVKENEKIIGRGNTNIINSYLNFKGFIHTFHLSKSEYYSILFIVIVAGLIVLLYIFFSTNYRRYIIGIIFLLLPILLCFIIVVPARFLYPYYSILSVVILVRYISFRTTKKTFALLLYFFVFICFIGSLNKNENKLKVDIEYSENIKILEEFQSKNLNKIIIIENLIPLNLIPVSPLKKIKRNNILFLNLCWFNSFNCFQNKWKNICLCDPLSIRDKLEFVAKNKYPIIISNERIKFYERYLFIKYNLNPKFKHVDKLSQNINLFIIDFAK